MALRHPSRPPVDWQPNGHGFQRGRQRRRARAAGSDRSYWPSGERGEHRPPRTGKCVHPHPHRGLHSQRHVDYPGGRQHLPCRSHWLRRWRGRRSHCHRRCQQGGWLRRRGRLLAGGMAHTRRDAPGIPSCSRSGSHRTGRRCGCGHSAHRRQPRNCGQPQSLWRPRRGLRWWPWLQQYRYSEPLGWRRRWQPCRRWYWRDRFEYRG